MSEPKANVVVNEDSVVITLNEDGAAAFYNMVEYAFRPSMDWTATRSTGSTARLRGDDGDGDDNTELADFLYGMTQVPGFEYLAEEVFDRQYDEREAAEVQAAVAAAEKYQLMVKYAPAGFVWCGVHDQYEDELATGLGRAERAG